MRYVLWGLGILFFCALCLLAYAEAKVALNPAIKGLLIAVAALAVLGWMAEVLRKLDAIKERLPEKHPPSA